MTTGNTPDHYLQTQGEDDELIEATPKPIHLLKAHERQRAGREEAAE